MHPRSEFRVEIDPDFTFSQQEDIIQAFEDWEKSVAPSNLVFHIWEGGMICGGETFCDGVITIHPRTKDELHYLNPDSGEELLGFTGWHWYYSVYHGEVNYSNIFIYPNPDDDMNDIDMTHWRQAIRHEIGHALSLEHTGPGTIMCPNNKCASPNITQEDVQQFRQLRE